MRGTTPSTPTLPRPLPESEGGFVSRSHVLHVAIAWRLRKSWRAAALLKRVAHYAAAAAGFRFGDLSIAVVGDAAMRRLHAAHLHDPRPTDVLTFDLGTHRRSGRLDAEIIVCADVARRCAAARSRGPIHDRPLREARRCAAARSRAPVRDHALREARRELALYVVHGVLHLAGYNDHRPTDFRRMHAREDELLRELGLGAVFAPAR